MLFCPSVQRPFGQISVWLCSPSSLLPTPISSIMTMIQKLFLELLEGCHPQFGHWRNRNKREKENRIWLPVKPEVKTSYCNSDLSSFPFSSLSHVWLLATSLLQKSNSGLLNEKIWRLAQKSVSPGSPDASDEFSNALRWDMVGSKPEKEANEKYNSLRLSHDPLLLSVGKGSSCSIFSAKPDLALCWFPWWLCLCLYS